jgi:hypothetical protein
MLVTMILISAMLSGAAVMVSLHLESVRGSGVTVSKVSSLYCAEAGITRARRTVAASYSQWNAALGQTVEPSWLAALDHDLDGDGVADFTLQLRDNEDEVPSNVQRDNDLSVFIVSRCTKYPDTPTEVMELVRFNGAGNCYDAQLGGCGGNANAN